MQTVDSPCETMSMLTPVQLRAAVCAGIIMNALIPLALDTGYGYLLIGATLILFLSLISESNPAIEIALLNLLILIWKPFWPPYQPFFLLVPLLLYVVGAGVIRGWSTFLPLLTFGVFDRTVRRLALATMLISGGALVLWFTLEGGNNGQWTAWIPRGNLLILSGIGVGFSVMNALIEETIYRGIIMGSLDSVYGPGAVSVFIQAIPFAALHIRGIPNGWTGVLMAGIFGLMLGLIRRRSQGLAAPVVAHVGADLIIFTILVALIR